MTKPQLKLLRRLAALDTPYSPIGPEWNTIYALARVKAIEPVVDYRTYQITDTGRAWLHAEGYPT